MKTLLYILLACIPFTAISQNIPTPQIISVKVDQATGFPILEWKISNTSLVDGYIIKRKIIDGQGVVSGTFNNVAVISDSQTFTYLDNSTSFGTSAQPLIRPEEYTVASYKVIDGKNHYSLMSDPVTTLTVSGKYDQCTKTYSFTYSEPDGAVQYHLHTYNPSDTKLAVSVVNRMDFKFQDFVATRTFAIECLMPNGQSFYSPYIDIDAAQVSLPDVFEISTVGLSQNGKISVCGSVSKSENLVYLRRHSLSDDTYQTMEIGDNIVGYFCHDDPDAVPTQNYAYRLLLQNRCGQVIAESDSAYNIVLNVSPSDTDNGNHLYWNALRYWPNGPETIQLYRSVDNGPMELATTISPMYSDYTESMSNIIADPSQYKGHFCYQLAFWGSDGQVINTNTACMDHDPVIYIPNALNPKSDNQNDWEFKPRADFLLDYKMVIMDKRGAVIFVSEDVDRGWDGYDRTSKLCSRDTYVYQITYRSAAGKKIVKSGFVNLVY